jgi:hypothetical protein
MTIETSRSNIRAVKTSDSLFTIHDGFVIANRAGFEISSSCPYSYRQIIQECINNGWLKPVAFMHEREVVLNGLTQ